MQWLNGCSGHRNNCVPCSPHSPSPKLYHLASQFLVAPWCCAPGCQAWMAQCLGWLDLGVLGCACMGCQWQLHAVHQRHPYKQPWLSFICRLGDIALARRNNSWSYLNNLAPYGWPVRMSRQQLPGAAVAAIGHIYAIAPLPTQLLCYFMIGVGGHCQGSADEDHT